ncbi:hypothetical protein BDB00DRAFT_802238 [Zychaea mexicana]|uniref:uncharacterized protein n=1 Tax=Zychaea mexicana TaxID=64656 RepID=UPI0022FDB163|nr:uncharacterized protein BDB00DRAFT_802238 [Zychaea mexicana]KAI9497868.1 hypothetical protein BDB00DRAFT_802238 [Zychaea mexicana]
MLCLYMHSDRQPLLTTRLPLACVLDEKHAESDNRQSTIKTPIVNSVSFDPFTHASTLLHQQSDFTWSIFDNVLARALRSMASALSNLPQDPRAKKSSAIIVAPSPIIISPSYSAAVAAITGTKRCPSNNKRAPPTLKQRHRHVCWQPIAPNDDETAPQHLNNNNNNNSVLPAWMFTHKHSRDIRSNPDEIRKLAVKLEMVRQKKLTIGRVKSERKRHLPTRTDDFSPCRKSGLSQQL